FRSIAHEKLLIIPYRGITIFSISVASIVCQAESQTFVPHALLDKSLHDIRQLSDRAVSVVAFDRPGDASPGVVLEQDEPDAIERRSDRRYLDQDVDTVLILLHHALNPSHLSLDAAKPLDQIVFVVLIRAHGYAPSPEII